MSSTLKILVSDPGIFSGAHSVDGMQVIRCEPSPVSIAQVLSEEVSVLLTEVIPDIGHTSRALRWIHLLSAGYDQLVGHPICGRSGLRISTSAGVCAGHMAEFVVGQILRHVKRFDEMAALQETRHWPDRVRMATDTLRGRRAVIVGYGAAGRESARLLRALGVEVDVVQRSNGRQKFVGYMPFPGMGDPEGSLPGRVFTLDCLYEAVAEADFVILSIPLTERTRHLLNVSVLRALKRGAVIINIARGALIDHDALRQALEAGHVAHAYLDVFPVEPLPSNSPIWNFPQTSVTPHMAGVVPMDNTMAESLFRDNLERFRSGRPLLNEILPEKLLS